MPRLPAACFRVTCLPVVTSFKENSGAVVSNASIVDSVAAIVTSFSDLTSSYVTPAQANQCDPQIKTRTEYYIRGQRERSLKKGDRAAVLGRGIALVEQTDDKEALIVWGTRDPSLHQPVQQFAIAVGVVRRQALRQPPISFSITVDHVASGGTLLTQSCGGCLHPGNWRETTTAGILIALV